MKAGDTITVVEKLSVLTVGYDAAVASIGRQPTNVSFSVTRADGSKYTTTITKAKFDIVSVDCSMMGDIGIINIYGFNQKTPDQFNRAYSAVKSAGAVGILIDLRDNTGGSYDAACKILDVILPQGNLMSVTDSSGAQSVLYKSDSRYIEIPVCVLVGEKTRDAAELFASAIYDYQKGEIVGMNTKGILTVQNYFELSDGSAIKLTTGAWSTGRGAGIKDGHIVPSFEVIFSVANRRVLPPESDPQIMTAVDLIHNAAEQTYVPPVFVSGDSTAEENE
jgi:carboxyl-terminal processing protease